MKFASLQIGQTFMFGGTKYQKTSDERAEALLSGASVRFFVDDKVTPC